VTEPRVVVIAGASGFVGQHLARDLRQRGTWVRTIDRRSSADASWGDGAALRRVLEGSDLLVNLAGRSVGCRYTKATVDEILVSRTETTAALGQALTEVADPPELWINASTGTIYRDARDRPQDEASGELGTGLSVAVARAWEEELFAASAPVRKVALRMAIVLGPGGGALAPLTNLARLGLGGRMGDGGQRFSWVHVADVLRVVRHLYGTREISGPVNVATPEATTNADLMRALRAAVGVRVGLPTSAALLELGARLIRTETELVLKSRWVFPRVLLESGFTFAHPALAAALAQIMAASRLTGPRTG
jgi:uncharacterized protein